MTSTLGLTAGEAPRLTELSVDEKANLNGKQPSLSKRTASRLARLLIINGMGAATALAWQS
jgi:hypothetical protein